MSKIQKVQKNRNSSVAKDVKIIGNIFLLRVPKNMLRAGNSYAILLEDTMLLIDVVHKITKPAIEKYMEQYKPAGLIPTHRDLIGQTFASVEELSKWLGGTPVFIHPTDTGSTESVNLMLSWISLTSPLFTVPVIPADQS